jgi:hypothetical protein
MTQQHTPECRARIEGGQTGHLVLVRRTFDDEPVALFATRVEAIRFAAGLLIGEGDWPPTYRESAGSPSLALRPPGLMSRVQAVGVVSFKTGQPTPFMAVEPQE